MQLKFPDRITRAFIDLQVFMGQFNIELSKFMGISFSNAPAASGVLQAFSRWCSQSIHTACGI